jgi:Xaa-Pro aminopeptidase
MKNLLMVADSDHDANMLYAVGMFVPDPFIYLSIRGRSFIVMSDLEIDRAKAQAPHCRVKTRHNVNWLGGKVGTPPHIT